MFNSLTGTITGKTVQTLFLTTHGIEWEILVPESTLQRLPAVGEEARIYTWLQHTDALMVLYGFANVQERTLFFDLLKVDGIGPKAALKILGNINSGDLVRILDSGDVDSLQRVPGVGKKTAAKMLLQLKGKLRLDAVAEGTAVPRAASVPYGDVVEALLSMGYDRHLVEQKVAALATALRQDEAFCAQSTAQQEDAIFRQAIVELAQ